MSCCLSGQPDGEHAESAVVLDPTPVMQARGLEVREDAISMIAWVPVALRSSAQYGAAQLARLIAVLRHRLEAVADFASGRVQSISSRRSVRVSADISDPDYHADLVEDKARTVGPRRGRLGRRGSSLILPCRTG